MTGVRPLFIVLLTTILIAWGIGCASSHENKAIPEEYANNVVELNPPAGQNAAESTVYVDSVKAIEWDGQLSLLIMGSFPDGCTHIGGAQHEFSNGNTTIQLKAWRNPERMCTQALVSFSFIYHDLPEGRLRQAGSIYINKTEYPLTQ